MSHLTTVYAPDGEPFEVPNHKVGDLVLNQGWSQQKPETVAVEPAPEPQVFDEDDEPEPEVVDEDDYDPEGDEEEDEGADD